MTSQKYKSPFIRLKLVTPLIFSFHLDAPEKVSLTTNVTTSHKVCAGMMANFICTVEDSNPAVHTFTLFENGTVVSNKRDSGVWSRTLTTSGDSTYKCMVNNSVGVSSSDYINVIVEGETIEFFNITFFKR